MEFRVMLTHGYTVGIKDERFSTEHDLAAFVEQQVKSPRWVRLGRLVTFSQNIIGVECVA